MSVKARAVGLVPPSFLHGWPIVDLDGLGQSHSFVGNEMYFLFSVLPIICTLLASLKSNVSAGDSTNGAGLTRTECGKAGALLSPCRSIQTRGKPCTSRSR